MIFSFGSSQYVYPENLDSIFRLLSKIQNKTIELIIEEPGNKSEINLISHKGSIPRGGFSYTHNYKFYADKNGFKTISWDLIEPYKLQKGFFPFQQGTMNLSGWFQFN